MSPVNNSGIALISYVIARPEVEAIPVFRYIKIATSG
jgi:hypothetical protein